MSTLVLLRHGQSEWNLTNRFTGWVDVELSIQGEAEAVAAAQALREAGIRPDVVHTSVQRRATRTADLVLVELGLAGRVPVRRSWRLNERHYGALQGRDKKETAREHGEKQVKIWRRSYATAPPPMSEEHWLAQRADDTYGHVPDDALPYTESLADVVDRMMPYWWEGIAPDLEAGRTVLVVAHGNSLRALRMHLDDLSAESVVELNIPTGVPRVYELGPDLRPIVQPRDLGDPDAIRAAAEAVAKQTG